MYRCRKIGSATAFLVAPCLALACGSSAAAESTVFGGAILGHDRLVYAGVTVPLHAVQNDQTWAVRGTLSAGDNNYIAAIGKITEKQVRADLSALYQVFGSWGYVDAGLGARYVNTRLSPRDPGNRERGAQWEPVASASGQRSEGPWRVSGFGSYGFRVRDYYVRGDVSRTVTPMLRLGAEAIFDGDRNDDRQRFGPLLIVTPSRDFELQLSAGASHSNVRDGAYAAIGFRHSF
jgi:hypothetical protein